MTDKQGQLYCGCCGNEIGRSTRSDPDWCKRCQEPKHIRLGTAAVWQRTYFAWYGVDCPYQVSPVSSSLGGTEQ